jgi:hypothetical protein
MILAVLVVIPASCASLQSETTQAGAPATTAAAQQTTGQVSAENILFRDDFQDGDAEGWQVGPSWVVQQDGDLYTFDTTGEGYAFVPKGVAWKGDYAFKASYLLQAGTMAFSFDATQDGRYYVPIDADVISLVKEDAAGEKTVLTQAQAPEIGVQHYITMAKQNGTIQVYVDRTLWLSCQDPAPLSEGTIIVGSVEGTTAWVDDVLVNKIARTLPQGDPAVEAVDPSQVVAPPDDGPNLDNLPDPDDDLPDLPDNNNPDDLPLPEVTFTGWENGDLPVPGVQDLTVGRGAQVILEWDVKNALAAFLNGTPVQTADTWNVEVEEEIYYELEVIGLDEATYSYYVHITVTDVDDGGDGEGAHDTDLMVTATVTAQEGRDVLVHVEVHNQGDADAQALKLRWYAREESGVVERQTGCTIPAGETYSIDWAYTYSGTGTMHWIATIDEEENMPDPNRGNNVVRGTVVIAQ